MARKVKRAIALAGGGPAAGLHIGVLDFLKKQGIEFDVWALSCIGAWVGVIYNQADEGKEIEQTYEFFRDGVFRDDRSYSRFPVNNVFGPNWHQYARAYRDFVFNPKSYQDLFLPNEILESVRETMNFMTDPEKWTIGDFNWWVHNHVMAVNPFVRYMASMAFLSGVTGLSNIYYPDSTFLQKIRFDRLYDDGKPYIFHNAWNLSKQELELFSNRHEVYRSTWKEKGLKKLLRQKEPLRIRPIDAATLCACSALPFVEETVKIDGEVFCEGALVDTVNFRTLLDSHDHELDEIWVSRIVDAKQIHTPENLHDSLANLCQLFAATVGEDDVKLFKHHVMDDYRENEDKSWKGTVVEIGVSRNITYDWSDTNLRDGRDQGSKAAGNAYDKYQKEIGKKDPNKPLFIEVDEELLRGQRS